MFICSRHMTQVMSAMHALSVSQQVAPMHAAQRARGVDAPLSQIGTTQAGFDEQFV